MERDAKLTGLAQKLRKNQTKEEAKLWYQFLRRYPVRVHRQYVIGKYIVDFYCHKAKLVIELDGSQHFEEKGQEKDAQRDAYLQTQGIRVLRIPNNEVNRNFASVCEYIGEQVISRIMTIGDKDHG